MPSDDAAHQNGDSLSPKVMWNPKSKSNKMTEFMQSVNLKYSLKLETYRELWKWSTQNYDQFWGEVWSFMDVIHSETFTNIVDTSKSITENPQWFEGARLNYAENMMRFNDDKPAIVATGEGRDVVTVSFKQLNEKVALYASALKKLGVSCGNRVVGYIPNCKEAITIMLAAASIGAIYSSTSPDFGVTGVLERFHQIEPKVLFSVEAVRYNNKIHPHLPKLEQVVAGLPELEACVVIPFVAADDSSMDVTNVPKSMTLSSFLELGSADEPLVYQQLPFNHPLFIMYSSGTTGPPKCMVHSAGGTLLQHMKEHILHSNMTRSDSILYYTTTGWMMWNWMVGALPSGGSIVLYDGSPFHPKPDALWDVVEQQNVTILGTSAKCLAVIEERGLKPRETHKIAKLRCILSTGSPLAPHQFDYVRDHVKEDLQLASITGGTDIISCFMGQNPMLPVHRGELQSANLGMSVACFEETHDGAGEQIFNRPGELVCLKPFPCMPTYFWNDKDGALFKKAYFSNFPGIWSHGDFCIEKESTHGFVMLGRSDATLNPNGVRFGTSELYTIIETNFNDDVAKKCTAQANYAKINPVETNFSDEVVDCVAAAQRGSGKKRRGAGGEEQEEVKDQERVILFLKMAPGVVLDDDLKRTVQRTIRTLLSPRHVPAVVLEVADIPYTISGKKVEVAITRILAGIEIKQRGAFRNPESLDLYKNLEALEDF